MLFLLGKEMVHDIEELLDFDLEIIFFPHLPHDGIPQQLAELNGAARKLPFEPFVPRAGAALGKENLVVLVNNDGAHAHADVVDAFFMRVLVISALYQKRGAKSKT